MDSVPLVCISGQVPTHLIGTDAFQECDTTGITRPCTKHNWLVKDVKDQLQNHKFWTDLPIGTCRQVVNFSHNSVYDVPLIDFMYGDLFIKKA